MIEINKNYNESNLETMAKMPDNFIDLTVTSPPYDNLRMYKGFTMDWHKLITELYRTTKQGGVVVWVVGDATVKGSETGTSFKQALFATEAARPSLNPTPKSTLKAKQNLKKDIPASNKVQYVF